jgi:hypothetical protein
MRNKLIIEYIIINDKLKKYIRDTSLQRLRNCKLHLVESKFQTKQRFSCHGASKRNKLVQWNKQTNAVPEQTNLLKKPNMHTAEAEWLNI